MSNTHPLRIFLVAVAAMGCVACSTTSTRTADQGEDSYVPTGSHIKVKDKDATASSTSSMNQQDAQDILRRPGGATATPQGGGK